MYCDVNCRPYKGIYGNGLTEPSKVYLGWTARTRSLRVVAAEDIDAGEVLGSSSARWSTAASTELTDLATLAIAW